MKAWLDLDHYLYSQLKEYGLISQKFIVCVSGGVDSVALLASCVRTLKKDQIEVFHFHHGDFENSDFRNRSADFVKKICTDFDIKFIFRKARKHLKSEKEFRLARLSALKEIIDQEPKLIMWGHQSEDLLETRLIRLIRGSGPEGFAGMQIYRKPHFRPFLEKSRTDLVEYLNQRNLSWVDDPSNLETKYFRNWIRNRWLKDLEKKRPGSVHRLASSLELISESLQAEDKTSSLGLSQEGLNYQIFLTLSRFQQSRALALLLFNNGCTHFGQSHIKEILKRLDKSEKVLMFSIAGVKINVNAERIWVTK